MCGGFGRGIGCLEERISRFDIGFGCLISCYGRFDVDFGRSEGFIGGIVGFLWVK